MLTEYKSNRPLRSLGSSQLEIPRVHPKQGESIEDCDWLVVQEGNKRALLRVGSIISLHFEITGIIFPVLPYSLSLSLSHTHTHTHILYMYIYSLFFIYHAVVLNIFYRK